MMYYRVFEIKPLQKVHTNNIESRIQIKQLDGKQPSITIEWNNDVLSNKFAVNYLASIGIEVCSYSICQRGIDLLMTRNINTELV